MSVVQPFFHRRICLTLEYEKVHCSKNKNKAKSIELKAHNVFVEAHIHLTDDSNNVYRNMYLKVFA